MANIGLTFQVSARHRLKLLTISARLCLLQIPFHYGPSSGLTGSWKAGISLCTDVFYGLSHYPEPLVLSIRRGVRAFPQALILVSEWKECRL